MTGPRVSAAAMSSSRIRPAVGAVIRGRRRLGGAAPACWVGGVVLVGVSVLTGGTSLVEDEAAAEAELQGGDAQDQGEEDGAYGRCLAEVEPFEAGLVHHHHRGAGGVAGTAAGHHERLLE